MPRIYAYAEWFVALVFGHHTVVAPNPDIDSLYCWPVSSTMVSWPSTVATNHSAFVWTRGT